MLTLLLAMNLLVEKGDNSRCVSADCFFSSADLNGDDVLTWKEYEVASWIRVEKLSQLSAGRISEQEFRGSACPAASADCARSFHSMFVRLDQDRDGYLTRSEVARISRNLFTKLDQNKDGLISREENRAR